MPGKNVIMDFSHIYEEEDFYRHSHFEWVDCTDINGTDCFCTPEAGAEIRRRTAHLPAEGVHFLDSGDYHYVTEFWLEKITQPFNLLLFDYHSDMQPPKLPGMLTCGCWVKRALDKNKYLKRVCIAGPDEAAFSSIEQKYRERLLCISLQQLQERETWEKLKELENSLPVYISIDKDVLNTYFARTDWSQGGLSLSALEKLMALFESGCRVIGVDVCGESKADVNFLLNSTDEKINNRTNTELLRFLLKQKNA